MSYAVKEIVRTIQGEGAYTGRPAVFCRFTGCNLWTGREEDRAEAICQFCDTDFLRTDGPGGGLFRSAKDLSIAVDAAWKEGVSSFSRPFVVCTGGEPLLQCDEPLVEALHAIGFEIALETNGTRLPPPGIDWICVSPKAGVDLRLRTGQELKLVYPQDGIDPRQFESLDFDYYYLQPLMGPKTEENLALCKKYCQQHPRWKLSSQSHKILDLP